MVYEPHLAEPKEEPRRAGDAETNAVGFGGRLNLGVPGRARISLKPCLPLVSGIRWRRAAWQSPCPRLPEDGLSFFWRSQGRSPARNAFVFF